jgi:hypothetical protein
MPEGAAATLSHRIGCGAMWRRIVAARRRLLPPVIAPDGMLRQDLDDEASHSLPRWLS